MMVSVRSIHLRRAANGGEIAWQVMNEVALHRGASPHLVTMDAFVDGQHLTESVVRLPISEEIRRQNLTFGHLHSLTG